MASSVRYLLVAGVALVIGAGGWMLYGSLMPTFPDTPSGTSYSNDNVNQQNQSSGLPSGIVGVQPADREDTAASSIRASAEPRDTRWPPVDSGNTGMAGTTPDELQSEGMQLPDSTTPQSQTDTGMSLLPLTDSVEISSDEQDNAFGDAAASTGTEHEESAESLNGNDAALLPPGEVTPEDNVPGDVEGSDTALDTGAAFNDAPEDGEDTVAVAPESALLPNLMERQETVQDASREPPVIRYSRGKPVPGENTIRGKAGNSADVVDTSGIYGSASSRFGQQSSQGAGQVSGRTGLPTGQDSVILFAFVEDLAHLLVQGYWPAGSHPRAVSESFSTVSLKGLNTRYGVALQGFDAGGDRRNYARTRILEYTLRPSMVEGLYGLYAERFIREMHREASENRLLEGGKVFVLPTRNKASMFALYADKLKGVSAGIRSYFSSPGIAADINEYIVLEQKAHDAARRYAEGRDRQLSGVPMPHSVEKQYHALVAKREQVKMKVASAMRTNHSRPELDADSLVYLATWLHRRPPSAYEGMQSLANCFDRLALRMREEAAVLLRGE